MVTPPVDTVPLPALKMPASTMLGTVAVRVAPPLPVCRLLTTSTLPDP